MIETIHIFDEFSQSPDELTNEQRHKKRMTLDPMIYDILKHKYAAKLDAFWKDHIVPKDTDSYLVIVERRLHPNLAFLLYNAAYFARTWGIILICSDTNYEYCKTICGDKHVEIRPLFRGDPEPSVGKVDYNELLKRHEFYESLPGEYHLFLEVDCYLRKHIPDEWKQYDLIAAPYEWNEEAVGGGFCFRKKSASLQICQTSKNDVWAADTFFYNGAKLLQLNIPPFDIGITYVSESCIYEDPIGVHQWWTFFFPNQIEDAEEIFHSLLSMDIQ
jgi:hypothetical protein